MNKAFTKEQDEEKESEHDTDSAPNIPRGSKNYITPRGADRLKKEYRELKFKERPEILKVVTWAAGNGDRSENGDYLYGKKRLREIDRRLRFLSKRIDSIEIADPTTIKSEQILFGATVTILDEDDIQKTYAIVGIDEVNLEKGHISWISPLASALLRNRVGDFVTFNTPKGIREVEIVKIEYKELN